MKNIISFAFTLLIGILLSSSDILAQFSGTYAPGNWSTVQIASGNGTINTNSAPTSIALTGPDNLSAEAWTRYQIVIPTSGTVDFSWSVVHNDPTYDGFGYWLNSTYTELTNVTATGSSSINVSAGQIFAFYGHSYDGCCGTFTATITNFSAPTNSALNDAGVEKIITPEAGYCADSIDVSVLVRNFGINQISPVSVEWTLNGTAQTSVTYNGTLDTVGGAGADSAVISLGTHYYLDSNDIVVWTTSPNNATDTANENDSASLGFFASFPVLDLPDTAMCEGELVILDAGAEWSSYLWEDSSTFQQLVITQGDTISVTVTDVYGCEATDDVIVAEIDNPVVNLGDSVTACDFIILDAGNPGSSYVWNNFESTQTVYITQSGFYSVIVENAAGCQGFGSVDVEVFDSPVIDLGDDLVLCVDLNESEVLSVSGSYTSYDWSNGETTSSLSVGGTGTPTGTVEYVLEVTDDNGCSDRDTVSVKFKKCIPEGVDGLGNNNQFSLFPNPAKQSVQLAYTSEVMQEVEIKMFDVSGRLVKSILPPTQVQVFDEFIPLEGLGTGLYMIRVKTGESNQSYRLIID